VVRITGGRYRGRRLVVSENARPTTEVARKAAFDILGSRIAGASVLDACAGSGAYGLEALSRGAVRATFVEEERAARETLKRNIERLGVTAQAAVEGRSVAAYAALALRGESPARFDVVFHDPPFEVPSDEDLALLLRLLAFDGTLVHERGDDRIPDAGREPDDARRYGRTRLLFYRS
jgi:16S rRNA (guanine966-N2)-methyltransferase